MAAAPVVVNPTKIAPDVLAATITTLIMAVQAFSSNNMARAPPGPVLDPHLLNTSFDLGLRARLNAFTQAYKPLDIKLDGTAERFPPFLLALCIPTRNIQLDEAPSSGILTFLGGQKI